MCNGRYVGISLTELSDCGELATECRAYTSAFAITYESAAHTRSEGEREFLVRSAFHLVANLCFANSVRKSCSFLAMYLA